MSQLAVDVVLLPEAAIAEHAIRINAHLVAEYNSEIILHPETCLPHISLAMGCIDENDLSTIGDLFRKITSEEWPIDQLLMTGVVTSLNSKGWPVSSFAIAKTPPVQSLHERITKVMQDYFTYDVTPEMIHGRDKVAESTLTWIRTFRQKNSFGAFFPHITLGYGMVTEPMTFPIEFKAARLAVCHLGNHCTCRKVLVSLDL